MKYKIDTHLVRAFINTAIFFEYADEKILDVDASLMAMEQLASELQQMSDESKNEFIKEIRTLAADYGDKSAFVENIPEAFGLLENLERLPK